MIRQGSCSALQTRQISQNDEDDHHNPAHPLRSGSSIASVF
jgi:hypothetical protein